MDACQIRAKVVSAVDEKLGLVFFRNRPQAVLLHVDEYERLVREAEQVPVPARS